MDASENLSTDRVGWSLEEQFHIFAASAARISGSAWMFAAAVGLIALWGLTGPIFHYSDTWQLVINTTTTIITFLMVFLIQNTQNRDAKAVHLKLNELLRSVSDARNGLIDLEDLSEEQLKRLSVEFEKLRREAEAKGGNADSTAPRE